MDSWWYKFKTWVERCHKNAVKIVAQVEAQCDKEITESSLEVDFHDGAELVSAQARQALISLTECWRLSRTRLVVATLALKP